MSEKRLRMFAGPNGSGKSTVYESLKDKFNIGTYVNADDIEDRLAGSDEFKLSIFGIENTTREEFYLFLNNHTLKSKATADGYKIELEFQDGIILKPTKNTHSYEASILADFIRYKLIKNGERLSLETVMSHYSKVVTLQNSKSYGYKNYLYFVSTESVEINKQRVEERVLRGGHSVPVKKIEDRYYKSLDHLIDAIQYTYRAFIFDNSGDKSLLILDIFEGKKITIRSDFVPVWIDKYLLSKLHTI